ncbi:MAG: hypothetical protein HYV07_25035 [Deltaproteobacteria bacterium]|nr:hypothetical protein [Deltaproteobacteria bacterium]
MFVSPKTPRRAVLLVVLSGCSAEDALLSSDAPPRSRIEPPVVVRSSIREGFDSDASVESSSVALIDTNRGIVTLPFRDLPPLVDGPDVVLDGTLEAHGILKGSNVRVPPGASVVAPDSLEIRASSSISIEGRILVGAGGLTLVAGDRVAILGAVESAGPIRIWLARREGEVRVSGRVATLTRQEDASDSVSVFARGSVGIDGQLASGASTSGSSGDVTIYAYGDVSVRGPRALVVSGDATGLAGVIRIASEGRVEILDGAALLGGSTDAREGDGAQISLRAVKVSIGEAIVKAGSARRATGGSLELVASTLATLGGLMSGSGSIGGALVISVRTASIGGEAIAGGGQKGGGDVDLATAGELRLDGHVAGGSSECGSGGSVRVRVAGRLLVGQGSLAGGSSMPTLGRSCVDGAGSGGTVSVLAQVVEGEEFGTGGAGSPPGRVHVQQDPAFTADPPEIHARTLGWVVSRVFERPRIGVTPRLVSLLASTPPGTLVKIQLAEADELVWYDASTTEPELLDPLAQSRRFRYRVWLKGLPLDAPTVDDFEIDLTP